MIVCSDAWAPAQARADNLRLNKSVIADVFAIHHQAHCADKIISNPQLQLAAEWQTRDLMANRSLDADIGSDGSTPETRATAADYHGARVAETVAINPALAISGEELLRMWYYDPRDLSIMQDCGLSQMGVWSENSLDRTVVVAMYGQPR